MAGPVRTCVGCRRRAPQGELVRIVRSSDGRIALDPGGKAPGRGAYVCSGDKLKCFELAARGRLGRALRAPIGTDELEQIKQELVG